VCFVKIALCLKQIFQLGGSQTFSFPVDVFDTAYPRFVFKLRPALFDKGTVESCIVCNHHRCLRQHGQHFLVVDTLASHHVVGDVVNRSGFGWNRNAWVFEFVKYFQYAMHLTCLRIEFKQNHAQFDHFALCSVQTRGLGVQHNALEHLTACWRFAEHKLGLQPAKYSVVRVQRKRQSHVSGLAIVGDREGHSNHGTLFLGMRLRADAQAGTKAGPA